MKVSYHANVTKHHACMTVESIIDVYASRPFYISMENFGMADVNLSKYQKVGEVAIAHKQVVYIDEERFSPPLPRNRLQVTAS